MSEHDRLDAYLDNLLQADEPARASRPDHGLAPDLAAVARQVVAAEAVPPLTADARGHIWAAAVQQAEAQRTPSNGHWSGKDAVMNGVTQVIPVVGPPRSIGRRLGMAAAVAALVLVIFAGLVLSGPHPAQQPDSAGVWSGATTTASPTSLWPTFIPPTTPRPYLWSSTQEPAALIPLEVTSGEPYTLDPADAPASGEPLAYTVAAQRDLDLTGQLAGGEVVAFKVTADEMLHGVVTLESGGLLHLILSAEYDTLDSLAYQVINRTRLVTFPVEGTDALWIYVDNRGPAATQYRLHMQTFPLATRVQHGLLTAGQTIEGDLTGDQIALFQYDGLAGEVIQARLETDGSLDTRLLMQDFSSQTSILDDDSGPGFDPEIMDWVLTYSGTYTGAIIPTTPGGAGHYRLTLTQTGTSAIMPTSVGAALDANRRRWHQAQVIDPAGRYEATFDAEGHADFRFDVTEARTQYAVRWEGAASFSPAFSTVASNRPGGIGNYAALGAQQGLLDVFTTTRAGLRFDGEPGATLTLHIQPVSAIDLADTDEVEQTITADAPLALYRLMGQAGQTLTLAVTGQDGFDTQAYVLDAYLSPLAQDADSGPGRDPELESVMLAEDGTHYVVVLPQVAGTSGAFRLTLMVE